MTVQEAAAILGKSERTVRRWCETGKIQADKVTAVSGADEWHIKATSVEDLRTDDRALTEGVGQTADIVTAVSALENRMARLEGALAGQFMTEVSEALADLRSTYGQMTEALTGVSEEAREREQTLLERLEDQEQKAQHREETLLELMQSNHEAEERRAAEQTAQLEALRNELEEMKRRPWWKFWGK